jgi:glycosyltransferase involved in cell wall biosynthesis
VDRPIRILITNIGIANRTGTEIVAMDLASSLARLGHIPMIWAPRVDPVVAAPLLAAGIPVVARLDDLPCVPDIVHGHHHLETIEALRHFPCVPAIFVCHGGYWWHDAPPRHPRIRRYVAVDEFCRERLAGMAWIESSQVEVVWNAVDLDRYKPRPPLPQRPRRAVVFSNYAGPGTHAEPIQEACRRMGIESETVGSGAGNASSAPQRVLPGYDLVFAKARCALEAMATGCAVILCDTSGLGTMVTTASVRELRRWNFGFRVLQRPLFPELIADEIQRYDSTDAADVSAYIRGNAGLKNAVEQYLTLYRSVLDEPQPVSAGVDCHPATIPLQIDDQAALRLRFLTVPQSIATRRHFTFDVGLFNGAPVPIATAAPWPSLLMYRWLNASTGEMVVEHGIRSIIQPPAWPGGESVYSMRAIAPNEPGDYILRVTIIQEGWRWLDFLTPAVCADAPVTIAPELSVVHEVWHATI